ncbi:LysR family transcriptional regulator [Pseudonocardia sp. NPDC049635]|uniref:LysR family transcriptional regulator n=1 Tax=Pseudonocardia sp. NPDC049635 TaxID=3155506 RepID=UPI0033C0833E
MVGEVGLRQLEYLVALAREKHFGRAASACYASQSTLSAALRNLERQLGVTIARRGHRFHGFTPEGECVVGWAVRILAERDALRADLLRMKGGLSATVRIGAIPTAVPAVPALTVAWTAAHPEARTRVEAMSSREIGRRLTDFDLDVGLTYVTGEQQRENVLPLYRERYLLLVGAGTEVAAGDRMGWADVPGLSMCALAPDMQNRQIVDGALRDAGVEARVDVEADTLDALYAHLATGRWSAVVAHTWLRAFGIPAGMRAIPIGGEGPRPSVGLVLGPGGPASYVARAYVEAIRQAGVSAELDAGERAGPGGSGAKS